MASLLVNSTTTSATSPDVLRITFLVIGIVVGCGANLYLLIVVCASRTMRRRSVYKLILNTVITNLLDILLNLSFVLAFLTRQLNFDNVVCQVNSFFINWLDDVQILNLVLLAIERSVAVNFPRVHRKRFREGTCAVLIALIWVTSFATNVPIATLTIYSSPQIGRFSCGLKTKVTIFYTAFTLIACFLLPFCTIVGVYINICKVALQGNDEGGGQNKGQISTVWRELNMSKLTASATGAWIILVGPYTGLVYIDCIKYSTELSNIFNTEGAVVDDSYTLESVFFWMRNYYDICLPFLCVIFRRDVRRKTRHLACNGQILRCPRMKESPPSNQTKLHSISSPRRNVGNMQSAGRGQDKNVQGQKGGRRDEDDELDSVNSEDEEEARSPTPPNIPVIFATSEGLHVQTDASPYDSRGMDSVITARVIKCDVTNSSADLRGRDDEGKLINQQDEDEEGTSDYASNRDSDTYQLSNPISVRSATSHLSNGQRSVSQQQLIPLPRRQPRRQESVPGEVRQEGEMSPVTTNERCIDPQDNGKIVSPSGEKRRRKKGKVERTERQDVGADLEIARQPVNALYNGGNGDGQTGQETRERKPKRRRHHKRTASSSDVAPAPVYDTQVSKESTITPPSLTGSNGSAHGPEIRRARRRDRSRSEDGLPTEIDALPKPPRRLEPLDAGSVRGPENEEVGVETIPKEKPRKKRRKKKSSTDPAPIEMQMQSWNPT